MTANSMRALVTGGAGFIGSGLAHALVAQGNDVVVIDDLSTGALRNLPSGVIYPGPLDILTDAPRIDPYVASADCVFHLAGGVGVEYVLKNSVRTIAINVVGTEVMISLAAMHRKPFLLASTSEVYGNAFGPLSEGLASEETSSLTPYARSKWQAEQIALAYHARGQASVVIVRLFNVVGARQTWRYGMVLPTFVKQALQGSDITIFGRGDNRRSFIDVRDAVSSMVETMQTTAGRGEVINIGSNDSVSIAELAGRIKRAVRSTSRIVHIPYRETYRSSHLNPHERIPEISKLIALTGFRRRYTLEDSITDAVSYVSYELVPTDHRHRGAVVG
ncbi:MAG: NAD-dependent epimerase/dehydratase family protein [Gammaproteobacteria bacterium]|nr:NAD-dependent epimerase/dehydratase family protein [Gammaproteobacteria bacterium]